PCAGIPARPARPRASRRRAARLLLEALEDRTMLSTFTILNLADSGDGSLRQAILDANVNPGPDQINFADGLSGTIALTGGHLTITDGLTIDGPGVDQLAVSGSSQSRVFSISGGAMVTIAGLTIRDGKAVGAVGAPALGGGILNTSSTLTLIQDVL